MRIKELVSLLKTKEYFLIILVFLKISIDLSFIYVISPLFSYYDMDMQFNLLKYIESFALLIIVGLTFEHRNKESSNFFIMFFLLLLIVPALSVYGLKNESRAFMYALIASMYIMRFVANVPLVRPVTLRTNIDGVKIFTGIGIALTLLIFAWIVARGGFRYLNFSLAQVYDYRKEAGSALFPGKLTLLSNWYAKIINPTLIVVSLWKKKYKYMIFAVFCQIMMFGFTSHKSVLFFPILIFFVYFMKQKEYILNAMATALLVLVITTTLLWVIFEWLMPVSLFVRRVLLVTAHNHFRYYDSFKELGYLYFSDKSWVNGGNSYPYSVPIQALISQIYYGHTNTWVNTGFLANGYVNIGFFGMFFYSIVVGLILRVINYCEKRIPQWICLGITIVPIFNLLSADLFTALMTHGIILSILVLVLLSKKSYTKELVDGRNYFTRSV